MAVAYLLHVCGVYVYPSCIAVISNNVLPIKHVSCLCPEEKKKRGGVSDYKRRSAARAKIMAGN